MNVTTSSTATPEQIRAALSPGQAELVIDACNAYQAQAAAECEHAAAKRARSDHARKTRTERLHAAIDALIEGHRPQLKAWKKSRRSRAEWAKKQIITDAEKGNTKANPLVPSWRYIDDYLKTLHL
ncbi:hypothetical protein F3I62_03550 [Pseudomonas sp. R-28-1W-6]|uniref:hypothetical protein n=1 Tax=Pseudomonas sp. R-28-1W-6 TaxID=2650101 RepID=UPI0013664B85|nr:hypothetical protein [Pseudomonas sp. R-28-1W-6]MWV11163.1 hypothetical protein [Pseudomonas sp. R-28-1W-6]